MADITEPIVLDSTMKENGRKLDAMNLLLASIAASQRALAGAQEAQTAELDCSTIRALVKAGQAPKLFPVGTQLVNTYTDKDGKTHDCLWDVVQPEDTAEGESGSTAPALTLQMHCATLYNVPLSDYQAFYIVPEGGMVAGTYHVTFGFDWGTNVKAGAVWQFTTSRALAAGTRLCGFYDAPDAAISSRKVYAYKDQYKSELLDTCGISSGSEGTDLGTFLKQENGSLNSLQAAAYGDNRWWKSVYRQYLNSDAPAGSWWKPQDKWDMMPECARTLPGFLAGFSEEFRAALTPVKVVTCGNNVTDDGSAFVTYDKVFLPGLEELYLQPQAPGEGGVWPYWRERTGTAEPQAVFGTYPVRITHDMTQSAAGQNLRLRSVNRGYASYALGVTSKGGVYGWSGTGTGRAAPACKLTLLG